MSNTEPEPGRPEPGQPEPGQQAEDTGPEDRGTLPAGLPSRTAFLLAFASVVVGGLFGGIIGYGLIDAGCSSGDCGETELIGTVVGAVIAAGGIGIVAVLVLRAMAEWKRSPKS